MNVYNTGSGRRNSSSGRWLDKVYRVMKGQRSRRTQFGFVLKIVFLTVFVVATFHFWRKVIRLDELGNTTKEVDGKVELLGGKKSSDRNVLKGPFGHRSSGMLNQSFVVEQPSAAHFIGQPDSSRILILQYTEFYHSLKPGSFSKCKYPRCDWTTDRSKLNQSHVVLFHMWGGVLRKLGLPKRHPLWQKWIFFTKEAPTRYKFNTWSPMLGAVYHLDLPHLNGAFNMTMTYMTDSDVPFVYGRPKKRIVPKVTGQNYAEGKTHQVAWVVSHCETSSGREKLVKELQKYVQVDIYGKCGPYDCPKNCFGYLGKKYKFYLALENSDCDDYISEKFWFNSFSNGMVPIVRGQRSNYDKLAPPHSFIHWDKYTVVELANLIKKLDKDDKLYNEYFNWKKNYEIDNMTKWMCDLCEYLHKNNRTVKYYTNIENFWDAQVRCKL